MQGINMESYHERGRFLVGRLERMITVTEVVYPAVHRSSIQVIIDRFQEERFKVVVVGEFSRGKSTFINALLGKEIFPSSRVPTTTVISKLEYNEHPTYTLEFKEPATPDQKITEDEFKAIKAVPKSFSGDPEMERIYLEDRERVESIKLAVVGYPLLLLSNDVELIDTPGFNDTEEKRERVTQEYIPHSDAVIFVLSAKQIMAETEMLFLDKIQKQDIKRIFFVINFSDTLKTEEARNKILEYAMEKLSKKSIKNPSINLISSKIALKARRKQNGEVVEGDIKPFEQSGFIDFEEKISSFLEEDRGRTKLEKPAANGIRLIRDVKEKIAIERNTLYQSSHEIEQHIQKLTPQLRKYRSSVDAITNTYQLKIQTGKQELLSILEGGLKVIASTAIRTVQNYEGEMDGESIQQAIEAETTPMQSRLQNEVTNRQERVISSAIQQAKERFGRENGELENTLTTVLSTRQESGQHSFTTSDRERYDVSFDANMDDSTKTGIAAVGAGLIGLNVIGSIGLAGLFFAPLLIPAAFIGIGGLLNSFFRDGNRQKVMAKVRSQVEERYHLQIPTILQKFEDEWDYQARMAAAQFFEVANRRVDSIEEQLQAILQRKLSEQERTEEREKALMEAEKQLTLLEEELHSVLKEKEVSLL